MKRAAIALLVLVFEGCATTARPPEPAPAQTLQGIASWYGEEFAGRTTANGEIFDPLLLTAAHRTLPFGTVLDVTNSKTKQTVRVRVNDRGPYVGGRIFDLSYGAAKQIGLVEPGSGEVEAIIVRVGRGDLEPPAAFEVSVADIPPLAAQPSMVKETPAVREPALKEPPAVVDRVQVVEEHRPQPAPAVEAIPVVVEAPVETRRQVAADGRTVETVAVTPTGHTTTVPSAPGHSSAAALDATTHPGAKSTLGVPARTASTGKFVVQVGAFAQQVNAAALQRRLHDLGQESHIESRDLFRVQIGPFDTREQAIQARARLERTGVSAIILPANP